MGNRYYDGPRSDHFDGVRFSNFGRAPEPRRFMGEQHASPADAVQILRDCGARRALGFHWGTFDLADEGLDRPVHDLEAALDAAGVERARFHAMRPGEHLLP